MFDKIDVLLFFLYLITISKKLAIKIDGIIT